jgi:hypothetical protein
MDLMAYLTPEGTLLVDSLLGETMLYDLERAVKRAVLLLTMQLKTLMTPFLRYCYIFLSK